MVKMQGIDRIVEISAAKMKHSEKIHNYVYLRIVEEVRKILERSFVGQMEQEPWASTKCAIGKISDDFMADRDEHIKSSGEWIVKSDLTIDELPEPSKGFGVKLPAVKDEGDPWDCGCSLLHGHKYDCFRFKNR